MARYFKDVLPVIAYPGYDSKTPTGGYVNDFLDGGDAIQSPWKPRPEIAGQFAPEGLLPWRRDDDSGEAPVTAASMSSSGNDNSNMDGVRGAGSDMLQRGATTRSSMGPPRRLTNAEVLLCSILFDCIGFSVGRWSEDVVNPLVEWIQAHSTNEGED